MLYIIILVQEWGNSSKSDRLLGCVYGKSRGNTTFTVVVFLV